MTLKHTFQSAIADGTSTSVIRPSNWNADHTVSGPSGQVQFNNAGSLSGMSGTSWDDTNRVLTFGPSGGGSGFSFSAPAGSSNAMQLGAADSASPAAQRLQAQSVLAGTTSVAGVDFSFQGSLSTGNAAAGNLDFFTGWKGEPSSTSLTVTISNAAGVQPPAVVECTSAMSNGLLPGQRIQFTTTGTLPAPLQVGTTYYWLGFADGTHPAGIIDLAGASNIATTPGGTPILTTTAGSGVHTLITPTVNQVNGPLIVNSANAPVPLPSGNVPTLQLGPAGITGTQTTPAVTITRTDSSNNFLNADAGIVLNMWRNGGGAGEKNSYLNIYHNGLPYFSVRRPGSDSDFMIGTPAGFAGTGGCMQFQVYVGALKVGLGAQTTSNGIPIVYTVPSTQIAARTDGSGGIAQYGYIGFTPSTQLDGNTSAVSNPDAMLYREGTGIIAQRDGYTGTNPQRKHLYNLSDTIAGGIVPTNYERALIGWVNGTMTIATQVAGTLVGGTGVVLRDFALMKGSGIFLTSATTIVANLPAAGIKGRRHFVIDANAATFGTIAAGLGTNNVPVYDDGTNWRIG